ncbi:hypothetical protein P4200_16950 [Pseudomonas aeruginosa]|nr:hypothetical protein [Pseudomonas aeruginosa]
MKPMRSTTAHRPNYSKDGGNSGSVGLGWDTSKAKLSANYSQGRDNKQINLEQAVR